MQNVTIYKLYLNLIAYIRKKINYINKILNKINSLLSNKMRKNSSFLYS